ncbi:MAG: NAD-dependent epimerase/dehydratase family protein [Lachnospiraceae bacterium]|jgi:dihydroflavonol-4-reductase|nr:NAD-dependent epimerase/dehydratase family protein [Lachnospiraceae bacterium]
MVTNTQNGPAKRYIVTGAGGHLGSTILRELCASGREVYGLLLPGEKPKVTGSNVTYFTGDVCDPGSLRCLFENGKDRELYVIHTAALISIAGKMPPKLHAVNVEGVKNILSLCSLYRVHRLVHVSSVHAIPELPGDQIMREPDSFSAARVQGGYAKTKAEAAQAVLDAASEGLDAVIVFPSGIIGPYDSGKNHLVQMTAEYMHGRLPACVRGGYDFVDVRDAAHGCLLAAEYGRKGEGYILSGTNAALKELLALAGKYCGRGPVPALPVWLAEFAVPFIGAVARVRGTRPLYTAYSLSTVSGNSHFSNEKARQELHYTTRDMEETVRDMVEWLQREQ